GVKVVTAVLPMEPAAAKDLVFKIREALPENMICYRTMSYGGNTASTSCAVNPRLLPPGKRMRETCASAVAIPGN
ncbi:MAG: hypothetical protein E6547_00355, partial [Parabacteroides sp.]|nr:hypothetical protein [Parabacteroides sp.]